MSPEKKAPVVMFPGRASRKELDILYARLDSVSNLIEAMEEYRRVLRKAKSAANTRKLRTA